MDKNTYGQPQTQAVFSSENPEAGALPPPPVLKNGGSNPTETKSKGNGFWRGWPRDGVVKLNSDGSCLLNGRIAAGGVLRDAGGAWLSGFTQNLELGCSFSAELWGILSGIKLAKSLGFKRLSVESDNMETIKMISDNHAFGINSRNLIKAIKRLCSSFEIVDFSHIFREHNRVADRLAAAGHEGVLGVTTLSDPPSYLSSLLLEDRIGVSFPMLIPG